MKWFINIILVIILLVMIVPTIIVYLFPEQPQEKEIATPAKEENVIDMEIMDDEVNIRMYDHTKKEIVTIPLEEYIVGVVAAEMPAGFEMEALKAQAVAARTLAAYKMKSMGGRGCSNNNEADVCSFFAHCQAWLSEEEQRKNWGEEYNEKRSRIVKAVEETRGDIIVYEDKIIEVLFHSTSNGMTEDAGEVFSTSLPYYRVVESKGEENAQRFKGEFLFTNNEFIDIFKENYPKATLTSDKLSSQVRILSKTDSGRVREVEVGGVKIRGTDFRRIFDLYSTDFEFSFENGRVVITTTGFGHGVGMSQVGANSMALSGYDYKSIIAHYYKGVEIENIKKYS